MIENAENQPLPESHESPVNAEETQGQGASPSAEGAAVTKEVGVAEASDGATVGETIAKDEATKDHVAVPDSEDEVEGLVQEKENVPDEKEAPVEAVGSEQQTSPATEDQGRSHEIPTPAPAPTVTAEGQDAPAGDGETVTETEQNDPASSIPSTIVRAPTPSSRTSTPPLSASGNGTAPVKSFRAVNVNKRFLSKTSSPSGTAPSLAKLSGRTSTSPVPIASTSSRLLSTKLTTIPSSKSSTSPGPSTPGSAASSSPWAKPTPPQPESASQNAGLQHPAPTRARLVSSSGVAMGSGQGIGGAAQKRAWKTVSAAERRAAIGMARDFPTASEVAEGKKAAQLAAQAQAAHNQEILKGLNAFTQLGSEHRWIDEDDDDDVLDFGDGMVYHPDEHPDMQMIQPEPLLDQPVAKSERFVEDFDRSWPRRPPPQQQQQQQQQQQPPPPPAAEPAAPSALPQRPPADSDRVLFNANSNRLEPSRRQPPAQPQSQQPPRLLSRDDSSPRAAAPSAAPPASGPPRNFDRPLPPHLQHDPSHPTEHREPPPRSAWGRSAAPPAQMQTQTRTSPAASLSPLPPGRRSFSQHPEPTRPAQQPSEVAQSPSQPAEGVAPAAVSPSVDSQTQEMHAAAEKARLRRLAEEQEREAAAERARKKAKELEERFGPKPSASTTDKTAVAPQAPPGLPAPAKQITIAQRPKAVETQAKPAPVTSQSNGPAAGTPLKTGVAHLPSRPAPTERAEDSWRSKTATSSRTERFDATARPTAESFFDTPTEQASRARRPSGSPAVPVAQPSVVEPVVRIPGSPEKAGKKETNFDNMLARIQAAMHEARIAPPSPGSAAQPSPNSQPSSVSPLPPKADLSTPASTRDFFDVTQPAPPRSPLPAWRTYNVRLPRSSAPRPSPAKARLDRFEAPRRPSPAGWIMSFTPAIEHLNILTLSRSELLVPQPSVRRFSRFPDAGPIVSISTRQFEPFAKKKRKSLPTASSNANAEVIQPVMSSSSLLGTSASPLPNRTDSWQESSSTVPSRQKAKSPVKSSPAVKAEKRGLFATDGVGVSQRARSNSDLKPGVRFMVSSELDGDSLLDEVNKMSLETVEEGMDHRDEIGEGRASGSETPKTPPSLSATSSRGGHASSPNGTTTPWSNATQQPAQQNHIKNMWASTGAAVEASEPTQPTSTSTSTPAQEPSTPLYPSLNAPSSSDPPASRQNHPNAMKIPYSQSQTFSPNTNTTASSAYSSLRPSASTGQFGYTQSPDQQSNMIGLYARSPGNNATSSVNGYGMQQGLWSSSAFSSGYGYSKPSPNPSTMNSMDQKAAMAFNSAQSHGLGKDSTSPYAGNMNEYRQQQQQGQAYSPTAYQSHNPQVHVQPHHNQHQHQHQLHQQRQHPHQQHATSQSSPYAQSPYMTAARGMTSPNSYGYNYGAPGSHLANASTAQQQQAAAAAAAAARSGMAGRVDATGGGAGMNDIQAYSGGYYGGVGINPQQMYAYGTAGAVTGAQAGVAGGAVGQAGRLGSAIGGAAQSQRKMW